MKKAPFFGAESCTFWQQNMELISCLTMGNMQKGEAIIMKEVRVNRPWQKPSQQRGTIA